MLPTFTVSGGFTRPGDITAYASGDLVANSTTAGSVTPIRLGIGEGGQIRRARLRKSDPGTTNAQFRVHLFAGSPTVANGDNGAISSNMVANYLGAIDVTIGQAFTDGAAGLGVPNNGSEINSEAGVVYALIEARAAYTPVSAEVFTLALEIQR